MATSHKFLSAMIWGCNLIPRLFSLPPLREGPWLLLVTWLHHYYQSEYIHSIILFRLQLVQNSADHLVIASRKHEHITPILEHLHCLPVHFRIIFKLLLSIYKALNGQAPSYIRKLLTYKNSGRVLRSLNNQLLDEPVANLKTYGNRAYSVVRTKTLDIRKTSSVTLFGAKLKTYRLICNFYLLVPDFVEWLCSF